MSDPKVHLLPFTTDFEGPINTQSYFKIEKENEQYESVMMGRHLVGTAVSLHNSSTQAHIWEKDGLDSYDDDDMDVDNIESTPWTKTDTSFEEFILWKKDTAPNSKDPRINAIQDWVEISQAIHTSIPLPTTTTTATTTTATTTTSTSLPV